MKRCNLFVVGAQRSGTTALKYYLEQHPDLSSGKGKEVHFYDRWYADAPTTTIRDAMCRLKFPRATGARLFDVSPSYMFLPHAMERIVRDRPEARLLAVLRSPVARAASQWRLETHRNDEHLTFSDAIRRPVAQRDILRHTYLERGLYGLQLRRLLSLFPRSHFLAIRSEDLRSNPASTMNRVWAHFSLPPMEIVHPRTPVHASQIEFQPSADDIRYLLDYYSISIYQTEEILGWDLSAWRDPSTAAAL